jgi:hypothetical protein
VVSCGDFILHFPVGLWCWMSFQEVVDNWFIFFGETSIYILCPFSNWAAFPSIIDL